VLLMTEVMLVRITAHRSCRFAADVLLITSHCYFWYRLSTAGSGLCWRVGSRWYSG